MSYCPKCGAQIKEGQAFCSKCGYQLTTRENNTDNSNTQPLYTNPVEIPTEQYPVYSTPQKSTFVMDKNVKIGLISAAAVAVVLIALFLIGSTLTKPGRAVASFQKAVASNNAKELSKVLYTTDKRLKIDQKSVGPVLAYFKDNPSSLNEIVQDLNNEAAKLKVPNGTFALQKVGKKFLFFPDYRIVIRPSYLEVDAKVANADFSLDSNNIGKSDSDNFQKEYGPYIPGEYNFMANYDGKYVSLQEPQKVDLVSTSNQVVNVFQDLTYLNISSEYPDAELFVNGKDAGIKVQDAGNFGPVDSNTTVYAVTTKDGQKIQSDTYTVGQGDNSYVYLDFSQAESNLTSIEGQVDNLINDYVNSFAYAVNYGDFSIVEPYITPGSSLYTTQSSYVPNTFKQGITENIESYNITSCTINDDQKSGTVTTHETYEVGKAGSTSEQSFDYKYTFQYNEETQTFQLSSITKNQ